MKVKIFSDTNTSSEVAVRKVTDNIAEFEKKYAIVSAVPACSMVPQNAGNKNLAFFFSVVVVYKTKRARKK